LERMTALRIMEDHDRLLDSAGGGSGTVGLAARNRWALSAIFFMVALGLLLCTGRTSLAQQQARVQDPAGPAAPQRLAGQGSEGVPAAASRPVPRAERPASGAPASRPAGGLAQPRPAEPSGTPRTERQPAVSRPAPHPPPAEPGVPVGQERPAVTPGRQGPPPQRPAHVPPDHPQKPSQGANGPTGQHPERPFLEEPVDRGQAPGPDQQPTPRPEVVHEPRDNPQVDPRGGEDTGRPEDKGSHAKPGESGGLPDELGSRPENGGVGTPVQPEAQPGRGTVQEPGIGGGQPQAAAGKVPGKIRSGSDGKVSNTPAGSPPSDTGMTQEPGNRAASPALTSHETGQGSRSTERASPPPAKVASDTAAPPPAAVRGEDAVSSSGSSRAAGSASPAAPPDGGQQPVGYGGRAASEASFGSTEYFFGYLWDEGSYSVQQDQAGLGPLRDGARRFAAETSPGGTLTQRAPPLPLPSPFSGFGLTMSPAGFGASSSGEGYVPLLAVIFCCLSAVLWRGRYRAYGALLRAGTVPRLALERPG